MCMCEWWPRIKTPIYKYLIKKYIGILTNSSIESGLIYLYEAFQFNVMLPLQIFIDMETNMPSWHIDSASKVIENFIPQGFNP